jgi:hypothetical protein
MVRLKEIAEKDFLHRFWQVYIRNPIQFYFRILRISEVEEVEWEYSLEYFGNHYSRNLKVLYEPFIGKFISKVLF